MAPQTWLAKFDPDLAGVVLSTESERDGPCEPWPNATTWEESKDGYFNGVYHSVGRTAVWACRRAFWVDSRTLRHETGETCLVVKRKTRWIKSIVAFVVVIFVITEEWMSSGWHLSFTKDLFPQKHKYKYSILRHAKISFPTRSQCICNTCYVILQ